MTVVMNRRRLIGSIAALFVAPAIVRAESLMKIKPFDSGGCLNELALENALMECSRLKAEGVQVVYGNVKRAQHISAFFRKAFEPQLEEAFIDPFTGEISCS